MAILAELFLVLAGFASGISQEKEIHPAELEVFERAALFGRYVSQTGRIASDNIENPICRVIKKEVHLKYLEELASIENRIISQVSGLNKDLEIKGPLKDSLYYSTRIMSLTVDTWFAKFEFAHRILLAIDQPGNILTEWMSSFILENAGVPPLRQLGIDILSAMDRQWVKKLRLLISEGSECPQDLLNHPQAPEEPHLIRDIIQAMYQLNKAADRNPDLLEAILDLVERNDEFLNDEIAIPLERVQCTRVFNKVQQNVSAAVSQHFLQSQEVTSMLEILRSVVLLGSASFGTAYCDANGDLEVALRYYFDIDKELSASTLELAPSLVMASSDAPENSLHIEVYGNLEFMFSNEQCMIYESLFDWLSRLVIANNSIGIGAGHVPHLYKVFLNMLWDYYQLIIDNSFSALHNIMKSEVGANVRAEQDRILKKLISNLLLDSKSYRKLLGNVISTCCDGDLEALRYLVIELEENPERHNMDLQPFHKFI